MREPVIRGVGLAASLAYAAAVGLALCHAAADRRAGDRRLRRRSSAPTRSTRRRSTTGCGSSAPTSSSRRARRFARADAAERDAQAQFYIAYAYYREGWGRALQRRRAVRQGARRGRQGDRAGARRDGWSSTTRSADALGRRAARRAAARPDPRGRRTSTRCACSGRGNERAARSGRPADAASDDRAARAACSIGHAASRSCRRRSSRSCSATMLMAALVRSGALAPDRLLHGSRSMLANANGAVVLFALFAAAAQLLSDADAAQRPAAVVRRRLPVRAAAQYAGRACRIACGCCAASR